MSLIVSRQLADARRGSAESQAWLARLPGSLAQLAERWRLTVGKPFVGDGSAAWVAPVTTANGTRAVLKIGRPHMEAMHEIAALRFWDGSVTVRLLDADERLNAMLLEECAPGNSLRDATEAEQDAVIGRLLPQLWRSPSGWVGFRPLSDMIEYWIEETIADADQWRMPLQVERGIDALRSLCKTTTDHSLLFTDLHAGNVLRAQRSEWLAIDPKPFVGDPAFDATQHLLNCSGRLRQSPKATVNSFADILGVSRERVRLWTFARAAAEPRSDWDNDDWTELANALAP